MNDIPIATLSPALIPPADKTIRAIVTLSWPYSSSTRQCALLLAEPDFRLRSRQGQVRVRFTGASAEAVAKAHVGIGDEVVLSLKGAVWEQDSEASRTPGRSVDGELMYGTKLVLRILKESGDVALSIDAPLSPPRAIKDSEVATPLHRVGTSLLSGNGTSVGTLPECTYTSPAFAKRRRLSGDSLPSSSYDPFIDEDVGLDGTTRPTRTKFGSNLRWRYADRTPSPKKVQFADVPEDIVMAEVEAAPVSNPVSADPAQRNDMPPPASPAPGVLTLSNALPATIADTSALKPEKGLFTPKLQPVRSPTLPLPSPFPGDTRQTSLVSADTQPMLPYGTSGLPDASAEQDEAHNPVADTMLETDKAHTIQGQTTGDAVDVESVTTQVQPIYDERSIVPSSEDDMGESQNEGQNVMTSQAEPANADNQTKEHSVTQYEPLQTSARTAVRSPPFTLGVNGTGSTPQSAHITPQSDKDRIMASTLRSLFGFDGTTDGTSPMLAAPLTPTPSRAAWFLDLPPTPAVPVPVAGSLSHVIDSGQAANDSAERIAENIVGNPARPYIKEGAEGPAVFSNEATAAKLAIEPDEETGKQADAAIVKETHPQVIAGDADLRDEGRALSLSPTKSPRPSSPPSDLSASQEVPLRVPEVIELDSDSDSDDKPVYETTQSILAPVASDSQLEIQDSYPNSNADDLDALRAGEQFREQLSDESQEPASSLRNLIDQEPVERDVVLEPLSEKEREVELSVARERFEAVLMDVGPVNTVQTSSSIGRVLSPDSQEPQSLAARSDATARVPGESEDVSATITYPALEQTDHDAAATSKLGAGTDAEEEQSHEDPMEPPRHRIQIPRGPPSPPPPVMHSPPPISAEVQRLLDPRAPQSIPNMEDYMASTIAREVLGPQRNATAVDLDSSPSAPASPLDGHQADELFDQFIDDTQALQEQEDTNLLETGQDRVNEESAASHHESAENSQLIEIAETPVALAHVEPEALLYPSLPLSPSISQSLQDMFTQEAVETPATSFSAGFPVTPQLSQAESLDRSSIRLESQDTAPVFTSAHSIDDIEARERARLALLSSQHTVVPEISVETDASASQQQTTGYPEAEQSTAMKKTPARKNRSARLSNVPDAVSGWFSPKRDSIASATANAQKSGEASSPTLKQADGIQQDEEAYKMPTFESHGLATSLSYFTTLSRLPELLNPSSQQSHGTNTVDVLAVVADTLKEPTRASAGPRDYYTIFKVADYSIASSSATRVEVYRPWKATLPVASVGDVILLRAFAIKSRKREPYLLSTDASAWCVFRYEESSDDRKGDSVGQLREEMKGPPVELGHEERERASQLREWWQSTYASNGYANGSDDGAPGADLHSSAKTAIVAKI